MRRRSADVSFLAHISAILTSCPAWWICVATLSRPVFGIHTPTHGVWGYNIHFGFGGGSTSNTRNDTLPLLVEIHGYQQPRG